MDTVGVPLAPATGGGARKHGLSTDQFPVSAYVGGSKNRKDLKEVTHPSDEGGVASSNTSRLLRHIAYKSTSL